jgi:hypothetical protein
MRETAGETRQTILLARSPLVTYKELLETLKKFSADQLECTCLVYTPEDEEYRPVDFVVFSGVENDVLDYDHPFLLVGG